MGHHLVSISGWIVSTLFLKKTFWRSYGFAMSPARTKTFSRGLKNKQYDMCARVLVEIRPNLPWTFLKSEWFARAAPNSKMPSRSNSFRLQSNLSVFLCSFTCAIYDGKPSQFLLPHSLSSSLLLLFHYYYCFFFISNIITILISIIVTYIIYIYIYSKWVASLPSTKSIDKLW